LVSRADHDTTQSRQHSNMATLVGGLRQSSCQRQLASLCIRSRAPLWSQMRQEYGLRLASTDTSASTTSGGQLGNSGMLPAEYSVLSEDRKAQARAEISMLGVEHLDIKHARPVPATPSYFSRVPAMNDLHIRLSKLLTKYNHLPTVPSNEAPTMPWKKIAEMRAELGEPIKAMYFAQVIQIAKRLNLIEPSMRPAEVQQILESFVRDVDPMKNSPSATIIDKYGRAIAAGRRKTSSARAFVVEGTGEVLVNGKTLSEAFGRVHDRESAVWALTATQRLDKYNVWVLVEGGGTTGQAEAITLAIAKALVAHEPALKLALKKAGCMTRDARTVERKKHGRKKARKGPTWVKR
jgi:small subunit ribosomal protein S9